MGKWCFPRIPICHTFSIYCATNTTSPGHLNNRLGSWRYTINQDEGRLKAIKGENHYDLVNAVKICLVLDVVISKRFKLLEFNMYSGTQYSMTHFWVYGNNMIKAVHDKELLIHLFTSLKRCCIELVHGVEFKKMKRLNRCLY